MSNFRRLWWDKFLSKIINMSDYRIVLSHMLVGGTTAWCLYNTNKTGQIEWEWIYGAYAPLCIYSLTGMGMYGLGGYARNDDYRKLYELSYELVMVCPIPFHATEIALRQGVEAHFACIGTALPLIPVGILIANDEWKQKIVNIIVLTTGAIGGVLSAVNDNYFGILATVIGLVNHFFARTIPFGDVPPKVMYNAGLCCFIFCAFRSMENCKC